LHLSGHLNRRKFKKIRKAPKEGQRKIRKVKMTLSRASLREYWKTLEREKEDTYKRVGGHLHEGRRTSLTKGREDTCMRVGGHLQQGGRTLDA
jgi:hypothetical protein